MKHYRHFIKIASYLLFFFFFFFNDTATTEIYTLSLHDALPILRSRSRSAVGTASSPASSWPFTGKGASSVTRRLVRFWAGPRDRKSTRLNSSHGYISYAVFCLKKKKQPSRSVYCKPFINRKTVT